MKKFNLQKNTGITLVALVVTVIVLIILAGISISLVLGDNGIITKAREAKENYVKAAENEGTSLNELHAEVNEKISGQDGIQPVIDESSKLYNALKDKTPQEIINGVIVDGVETIFLSAEGNDAFIKYNNQTYTVTLDSESGSVASVEISSNISTTKLRMYDGTSFPLEDYVGLTWYEFACAIDYGECIVSYSSYNFEADLKTLILDKYEEEGDTGMIDWVLGKVEYLITGGAISTDQESDGPDQACNSRIVSGQKYYLVAWN